MGSTPSSYNNFQGRYIIRHPWQGAVLCAFPEWGQWGGPPDGDTVEILGALSPNSEGTSVNAEGADKLSDDLNELVLTPIPELGIHGNQAPGMFGGSGCGCETTRSTNNGLWVLGMGLWFLLSRRKKERG